MTHNIFDGKSAGCNTCSLDSAPCPGWSAVAPSPANGIDTPQFNGYSYGVWSVAFQNGEYYVGTYLNHLAGQKIPMFRARNEKYPMIARLLFDMDEYTGPSTEANATKPINILTFKSLPNMETLPSLDGNMFLWTEYKKEFPEVYVVRDQTNTNILLLGDAAGMPIDLSSTDLRYRNLFEAGDTILVYANGNETEDPDCCSRMEQRTVVSVDTEVWVGPQGSQTYVKLTLENTPTTGADLWSISVKGYNFAPNTVRPELNTSGITYAGDRVLKLYNGRNDCDTITASYQENPYARKHSYIQHISFKHDVTKQELNRSYAEENGVQSYLATKMQGLSEQMVDQMASAFYMARNRNPNNSVSYTRPDGTTAFLPGETMGVLPGLFDAHYMNPHKGLIQSARNLLIDEDKVRLVLEQLLQVQMSGAIKRGSTVTMVMDSMAISKFMQMNNAWNKFTGFMVTKTDNVHKEFTLPVIHTPYGPTEIMTCYKFEQLMNNTGNILFFPRDLVKFTQRENDYYDINTGAISKSAPGFRFEDVTLPWQHECKTYDIRTEFCIIIWMIESGAWRLITWFF